MHADADGSVDIGGQLQRLADSLHHEFRTAEDFATNFLRQTIVRGILAPGEKLDQELIANTLGISKIPLRSAVRRLEAERLVEVHPYRGASVRQLSTREVREIFELRIALETLALREAYQNMTAADLAVVAEAAHELDARSGDPMPWVDARRSFYQILYTYADRPLLLTLIDQLRSELGPHLAIHGSSDRHASHAELLELLERRDLDAAIAWITDHLREVEGRVVASVAGVQAEGPAGTA